MGSFFGGSVSGGGSVTQNDIVALMGPDVQTVTPTAGASVQVADNSRDTTLIVNPAGDLLTGTLTINFPSNANSRTGQIVMIRFRRNVTSVALANATFMGAITAAVIDDAFTFQKTAASTWEAIS
jgi:hypothetical protein